MTTYRRATHNLIAQLLERLDADFMARNRIYFGGDTRIVLELDEYRESVDVDLICVGREAYRAARTAYFEGEGFGALFRPGHAPPILGDRQVRADRDAIRGMLALEDTPIKMEVLHFEYDQALASPMMDVFPVPALDPVGCAYTKLTANADRWRDDQKDIVDLLMMRKAWGVLPAPAFDAAADAYGESVITDGLKGALSALKDDPQRALDALTGRLQMDPGLAARLINEDAPGWRAELDGSDNRPSPGNPEPS